MQTRFVRMSAAMSLLGAIAVAACSGDDDPTGLESCLESDPAITLGQPIQGTLEEGDELDFDDAFLDGYRLTLGGTTTVVITLSSTDFDAFLWLLGESGVIDSDDDSAGGTSGTDARITATLPSGCYRVETTSLAPGETGSYTLTVATQ